MAQTEIERNRCARIVAIEPAERRLPPEQPQRVEQARFQSGPQRVGRLPRFRCEGSDRPWRVVRGGEEGEARLVTRFADQGEWRESSDRLTLRCCKGITSSSQAITATERNSSPFARCVVLTDT